MGMILIGMAFMFLGYLVAKTKDDYIDSLNLDKWGELGKGTIVSLEPTDEKPGIDLYYGVVSYKVKDVEYFVKTFEPLYLYDVGDKMAVEYNEVDPNVAIARDIPWYLRRILLGTIAHNSLMYIGLYFFFFASKIAKFW